MCVSGCRFARPGFRTGDFGEPASREVGDAHRSRIKNPHPVILALPALPLGR